MSQEQQPELGQRRAAHWAQRVRDERFPVVRLRPSYDLASVDDLLAAARERLEQGLSVRWVLDHTRLEPGSRLRGGYDAAAVEAFLLELRTDAT